MLNLHCRSLEQFEAHNQANQSPEATSECVYKAASNALHTIMLVVQAWIRRCRYTPAEKITLMLRNVKSSKTSSEKAKVIFQ